MTKRLVLLASYPKSGNTWIRAFLTALWRDGCDLDINRLMIPNVSNRDFVDGLIGVPSAEFTFREISNLRPQLYSLAARSYLGEGRLFLKIHDAFICPPDGGPAPVDANDIDRVLYIVRDPRHIVGSLARHLSMPIDHAIRIMADRKYSLSFYPMRAGAQLTQFLSSWSAHVESWTNIRNLAIQVIRYEDMVKNTEVSFRSILEFLGISHTAESFSAALEATQFQRLQEKERTNGFIEKPKGDHNFFHAGDTTSWESALTPEQSAAIVESHGSAMERLNYL